MSTERKEWKKYNEHEAYGGCDVKHNGGGQRKGYEGKIVAIALTGRVHVDWMVKGVAVRNEYTPGWAERNLLIAPYDNEMDHADKTDVSKYIVWCPESEFAPRKVQTSAAADEAIAAMAQKYPGRTFYKCRLERKAVTQSLVVEDL